MIKKILAAVTAAMILLSLQSCAPRTTIMTETGIDISCCEIIENFDTHGEFFNGDGDALIIVDCGEKNEEILKQIEKKKWKKFPLKGDLSKISFPDPYGDLPESISSGYYYFRNRNSEAKSKDDTNIFTPYSRNYTIAIYDADKHILYYYEDDT